jgi:ribonuclease HI
MITPTSRVEGVKAKYATTCGVCQRGIEPGAEIRSLGTGSGRRWAHDACQPDLGLDVGEPTTGSAPELQLPGQGDLLTTAPAATAGVAALEVWTDGACSGNPGPGGWAWATEDGRQGFGSHPATTNQRMEVQAALDAVTTLPRPLVVVSDSTYVVNCFKDGWWRGWLARGWTNSQKKPVANRDLWEPLVESVRQGGVTFRWVKGHSGDEMNDVVDRLAVRAGREQSHS